MVHPGMKLLIYGDVHTEFEAFEPPDVEADVAVLAGDIGVKLGGLDLATQLAERMPVVYVAGNHEYYRGALPKLTDALREEGAARGVHFLECDAVDIGGVRFLGCTLWSDFMLHGPHKRQQCMADADMVMSDFHLIRRSPGYGRFTPMDAATSCLRSRQWLVEQLEAAASMPTVVVTHHAPSARSLSPRFRTSTVSAGFASNFDALVEASFARAWIHGHTHYCVDYSIGATRVVSNQRGYPHEPVAGFRPDFVVEI